MKACHEAGHAVASIFFTDIHARRRLSRMGTQPVIANLTAHACTLMREGRSTNRHTRFLRISFALYAGQLAQKRFALRSLRTHHVSTGSTQGHADNDNRRPSIEGKRHIGKQQKQIKALTIDPKKLSAQLEASKPAPQAVLNDQ